MLNPRKSHSRLPIRVQISLVLSVVLWSPALLAKDRPHVVVVSVANMFAGPSDKTAVVSQAIYGSNVKLLQARGEWSRIQTSDHYKGWTRSRYLRVLLTGSGYAIAGPTVHVESLFANIYGEPNVTQHKPIITVSYETRLEIAPEETPKKGKAAPVPHDGWLRIRLPEQRDGWVQESDVVSNPKPLTVSESIELAHRFLGFPYLWGGRSSFGFDCSGFTQMLVRARGINMPRDADQQAAWTGVSVVERKDLRPGDLLFFGSSAKEITHTGMYLGEGQFIHDTTHGHPVVQISKVDDQPWTNLLVACRRVKETLPPEGRSRSPQ